MRLLAVTSQISTTRTLTLARRHPFPDNANAKSVYRSRPPPPRNQQRNNNRKLVVQRRVSPSQLESSAQRILSARQHKISDQNNVIGDLRQQMELLRTENKTLKHQSYRQEKALSRIETKQSDLPQILDQHQTELHVAKEQLRRMRENLQTEQRQHKEADLELVKVKSALSRATTLVNERGLGERSALQAQLADANDRLEASDSNLKSLQRHLENMEKSRRREISNVKKQNKQYACVCERLELELKTVKMTIKEKEKMLEIQNIYSHRIKMPHHLPGSGGSAGPCVTCNGGPSHLERLDFSGVTNPAIGAAEPTSLQEQSQEYDQTEAQGDNMVNYLDPEKIKEDIRKILEEEILSGRIKPVQYNHSQLQQLPSSVEEADHETGQSFTIEYHSCASEKESQRPMEREENNEVVGADDATITSVTANSPHEEPDTMVSAATDDSPKHTATPHRPISVKINAGGPANLQYSYPHDTGRSDNDEATNPSELETIPISEENPGRRPSQPRKFDEVIENLHHGVPSHSVREQKNNSNSRSPEHNQQLGSRKQSQLLQSSQEDLALPPLSEEERQGRERELLSELFGSTYSSPPVVHGRPYPAGSQRPRASLTGAARPWDQDDSSTSGGGPGGSGNARRQLPIVGASSEDLETILL